MLAVSMLAAPSVAATPDDLAPSAEARFSAGVADPLPAAPWWQQLGDPQLAQAVDRALEGNLDLTRLRATLRQIEAVRLQAVSVLSPTVSANARTSLAPIESLGFGFGLPSDPTAPKTYTQGSATLDAQWQLDLFGRNTANFRASQRDAGATEADLDDLSESVASFAAHAYLDVVTARERVALVERQVQTNAELLEVLELRYQRGDATSLDVLQQRQQLASSRAQLPSARLVLQTTEQRLAVLLGRTPTEVVPTAAALPALGAEPVVGTPRDLVDNRPDLRSSAERLDATRDRRWAAYAGFMPTVGLAATAGWQFIDRGDFTDQTYWNAGASVSVPIFGGGRSWGAVQGARAAHDAQSAAHEGLLLLAIQQVEAALARETQQRLTIRALDEQEVAARLAFEAARDQYLRGVTPFINVQSTLGRLQLAELGSLQGRRDLLSARIALHEALGGPWTQDLGTSTESR
jgi:multidrug efflux system outer membrane protein